jgi:hypothetical protein
MDVFRFFAVLSLAGFLTVAAAAQDRSAVLIKGNTWGSGIPGFGSNVFSALSGEYRLDSKSAPDAGDSPAKEVFSVRVSTDPLVFSRDFWQHRPLPRGSALGDAMQREEEDGSFLVGFPFNGGNNMGTWTVLFQFPRESAFALTDAGINRLIAAWIGRFRYFLSLIKTSSDISLPAVVNF